MNSPSEDITGRSRIGRSIGAAWLGHVVVVISGFIVPRLIDERMDQASLGVWDFGWSTVTYFRFLGLGLAGGLNRYVALYRAQNDTEQLRRAVSSTGFLQLAVAAVTMIAALLMGYFTPHIFHPESAELATSARWLVILLGGSLAVAMLCWPARGVLTGYHHWELNTKITATGDVFVLLGSVAVLFLGGGLVWLGATYLFVSTCMEIGRVAFARAVYGEKLLTWTATDKAMMKKMLIFGIKTNVTASPFLIVVQTVNIVLATAGGPAMLALLARPMALSRHIQKAIMEGARVLVSTAGSLQGLGEDAQIRSLFLKTTRVSFAVTLPLLLALALYGDIAIRLWMGESYVDRLLPAIIAAGMVLPNSHLAAGSILIGLNMHGRIGVFSLVISVVTMLIGIAVVNQIGWTPVSAAVVIGLSTSLGPGLVIPISACWRFGIGFVEYMRQILPPIACGAVFGAAIGLPRLVLHDVSYWAAALVLASGLLLLAALYWIFVLDDETRAGLRKRFGPLLRRRNARAQ